MRSVALLPTMLSLVVSIGTLTTISVQPTRAEECVTKPYAKTPKGYHWYYYTVDDHRCWILRTPDEANSNLVSSNLVSSNLVSDVGTQDVQDVEADTPATAADAPTQVPPQAPKLILAPKAATPPRPASRVATVEHADLKPARSRFPTAQSALLDGEAPMKTANVPAAAFIVRWPNDLNRTAPPALAPVAAVTSNDAPPPAAREQQAAQPNAPTRAPAQSDASTTNALGAPIAADSSQIESLSAFFKFHSEHGLALMTTTLSLLTIAVGISFASRYSHRRREIEDRRVRWDVKTDPAKAEAAAPAAPGHDAPVAEAEIIVPPRRGPPVRVLDAPPMFHEPAEPAQSAGRHQPMQTFESALHKLLRELEALRTGRARAAYAPRARPRPTAGVEYLGTAHLNTRTGPDQYGLRSV